MPEKSQNSNEVIDPFTDQLLIREVIAALTHTHDDKDWEAFRDLLTTTVSIDLSNYLGVSPMTVSNHEAANRLAAALGAFQKTHHAASDVIIHVDGAAAVARSHITAFFYSENSEIARGYCAMRGTWNITLNKLRDRWLVTEMQITRTAPWEGDPTLFRGAPAVPLE